MIDSEIELLEFVCSGKLRQFSIHTPFDEVAHIMGDTTNNPNFPEYRFGDNFEIYSEGNRAIRIRFIFLPIVQGILYANWHSTLSYKSSSNISSFLQSRRVAHIIYTFSDLTTAIVLKDYTSYFTFDEIGEIHMVQFDRRGFNPLIMPVSSNVVN